MLRDFEYNPSKYQLAYVLLRFGFGLDLTTEEFSFDLLKFEVLTPDSFVWKLLINKSVYYLYAEDYIPSLNHVKNAFNSFIKNNKWEFVNPSKVIAFESASPIKHAAKYQKPDDADEIMKYAVDSGYDLIFLVKSFEDSNAAKFLKN